MTGPGLTGLIAGTPYHKKLVLSEGSAWESDFIAIDWSSECGGVTFTNPYPWLSFSNSRIKIAPTAPVGFYPFTIGYF